MNNNIKEPIGKYISQIYRKGRAFISKGLTQYDMGYGQMLFLLQLYRQDGISQEELTEKLSIDKGTTECHLFSIIYMISHCDCVSPTR